MNILVLSAGGPAAVGVIKSLMKDSYVEKIVAIDCDELAVGFHLSNKSYVVPRADSDDFFWRLSGIVAREEIDLILPTGPEIVPISKGIEELNALGAVAFMSDYEVIKLCMDKYVFYEKCKDMFLLPKTSLDWRDVVSPIGFFAKHRYEVGGGRGSKYCKTYHYIGSLEGNFEYIYQEYLPGQEYTIDVLCDMESNPLVVIPRKRLQVKAGISTKGEIIRDVFIERACHEMCRFLKLKGPVCIQMKEDANGTPKFTEINPRFGGGTYFTTLAGVNFCEIIIDLVKGKEVNISEFKCIRVLRYFEEVVV